MNTVPVGYVEGFTGRQGAFFEMLEREDDLGLVIRAHIFIEHELREFILAAAPKPQELKFLDHAYSRTLQIALALGLDPDLKAGLLALGAIRNKFAHQLNTKLTSEESRGLYSKFPPKIKTDMRQAYAATILKWPNTGRPKDMLKTTPKDLIAMCMLMLHTGVSHEHVKLRHAAITKSSAV